MLAQLISDACHRGHFAAAGGRSRRRRGRVSGLWRAAVAVGLWSLARGTHGAWHAPAHATTNDLRRLPDDACALSRVVAAAPPRRGRGDRPGARAGRERPRAPHDRRASWAPARGGPWVAARGQGTRCVPARVRDPVGVRLGPVSGAGHPGPAASWATRSRRSCSPPGHGCCASGPPAPRRGARRVADRRAAVRANQSTAVAFAPRAPAGSLAARLAATISEARAACQGQPVRDERSEPRSGGLDRTPQRSYRSRRTLPPDADLSSSFVPRPFRAGDERRRHVVCAVSAVWTA